MRKVDSKGSTIGRIGFRIAVPLIIGFAVIYFLFRKDFSVETFKQIELSRYWVYGLVLTLISVFAREFGMALRFNILTSNRLSINKSWLVTFLCEFTSAITPTSVGGSAVSMIFMNREGIKLGRATTITLVILFLDNLFFTLFCPLILLIVPMKKLFYIGDGELEFGLESAFWIVYGVMVVLTVFLFSAIFIMPEKCCAGLLRIFSIPGLRKWKNTMEEHAHNIVSASADIKGKKFRWWLGAFLSTSLSWCGRFLVVNSLFFLLIPNTPQLIIFGRQFVVWTLLMFTPTPGGSGLSEWLFDKYYTDLLSGNGLIMVLALLWRIFSYYIYLLIGVCLLPSFLNKTKP